MADRSKDNRSNSKYEFQNEDSEDDFDIDGDEYEKTGKSGKSYLK